MAQTSNTLVFDFHAQTLENCRFLSPEDTEISIITSKESTTGKFRATVVTRAEGYGRKKKRTALFSEVGGSMVEAFEQLHTRSAEAVEKHIATLGYGLAKEKRKKKSKSKNRSKPKSKSRAKGWEDVLGSSDDDSASSSSESDTAEDGLSGKDDDSDSEATQSTSHLSETSLSDDETLSISAGKGRGHTNKWGKRSGSKDAAMLSLLGAAAPDYPWPTDGVPPARRGPAGRPGPAGSVPSGLTTWPLMGRPVQPRPPPPPGFPGGIPAAHTHMAPPRQRGYRAGTPATAQHGRPLGSIAPPPPPPIRSFPQISSATALPLPLAAPAANAAAASPAVPCPQNVATAAPSLRPNTFFPPPPRAKPARATGPTSSSSPPSSSLAGAAALPAPVRRTERDMIVNITWAGHEQAACIFLRCTLSKRAIGQQAVRYVTAHRDVFGPERPHPPPAQPCSTPLLYTIQGVSMSSGTARSGGASQMYSLRAYNHDDLSPICNSMGGGVDGELPRFEVTVTGRIGTPYATTNPTPRPPSHPSPSPSSSSTTAAATPLTALTPPHRYAEVSRSYRHEDAAYDSESAADDE